MKVGLSSIHPVTHLPEKVVAQTFDAAGADEDVEGWASAF